MSAIPKITITGTKGKTTTSFVVADILQKLQHNVLRVDTTGHYINGKQRSTLDDSKETWGLVPTVSPGRYLWEFLVNPTLAERGVAVLEAALGSSASAGLGYREHTVGVFLNVFEDHLGSSARIQTKQDIATAKQFVFERIAKDGWAVFNADDPLVVDRLKVIPDGLDIHLLPCGFTFEHFDVDAHLAQGGLALTVDGPRIVLRTAEKDTVLADMSLIPWAFKGDYPPSTWNLLMSAGALYAYQNGSWNNELQVALESVRLEKYGGRMTLLRAASGTMILADYAHEKVSLHEVGKLARTFTGPGGRVIGIVRLAHDRTDTLIRETGEVIGQSFDECVIYEKIDGYWRSPKSVRSKQFPQIVGRTSQILAEGAHTTNKHVTRILREDEAVEFAAQMARPEDVVVMIVNDDIKRSLSFVQDSFKAEFI